MTLKSIVGHNCNSGQFRTEFSAASFVSFSSPSSLVGFIWQSRNVEKLHVRITGVQDPRAAVIQLDLEAPIGIRVVPVPGRCTL